LDTDKDAVLEVVGVTKKIKHWPGLERTGVFTFLEYCQDKRQKEMYDNLSNKFLFYRYIKPKNYI
jgi:hypothetical protein